MRLFGFGKVLRTVHGRFVADIVAHIMQKEEWKISMNERLSSFIIRIFSIKDKESAALRKVKQ